MQDFVITISREYGSGGHDIGKRLASLLDIPFYDREVVELTAKKHDLDESRLNEMEDMSKTPSPFLSARITPSCSMSATSARMRARIRV